MKLFNLKLLLFGPFIASMAFANIDIEKVKARYSSMLKKDYVLIPHNGTYLLPISYNASPNEDPYSNFTNIEQFSDRGDYNRNLEAEFQFSFLVLGARNVIGEDTNLFVGYTQKSWWQIYNSEWSRPFRETNYAPEVFLRKTFFNTEYKFLGAKVPLFDIGYIHESNGQLQELSRSWDRIFARTVLDFDGLILSPMFWLRLPEKKSDDDNSDIQNYLGYGQLKIIKNFNQKKQISLKIIPGIKRAGYELNYSQPWKRGYRFYTKLSAGTGLSLQDYDHEGHKFGIGFILNDYITSED